MASHTNEIKVKVEESENDPIAVLGDVGVDNSGYDMGEDVARAKIRFQDDCDADPLAMVDDGTQHAGGAAKRDQPEDDGKLSEPSTELMRMDSLSFKDYGTRKRDREDDFLDSPIPSGKVIALEKDRVFLDTGKADMTVQSEQQEVNPGVQSQDSMEDVHNILNAAKDTSGVYVASPPVDYELPSWPVLAQEKVLGLDTIDTADMSILGHDSLLPNEMVYEDDRKLPAQYQRPAQRPTRRSPRRHDPSVAQLPPADEEAVVLSGDTSHYSFPSTEELAECGNDRAQRALQTWYQRLRELAQFRREMGHTNVPQKFEANTQLGVWVNKQRSNRHKLGPRKLAALSSLNFDWGTKKGREAWDQKFNELQEYRSVHGNCDVPTKYEVNPALGRWVSTQRSQYKKKLAGLATAMDDEKIVLLESVGFKWSMT